MKSATFTILKNPSNEDVSKLLAQAGSAGLRGIEDYTAGVFLWPFNEATHMIAAGMLNITYDPASDFVNSLTGKTFYIRSLDDWVSRERRRSEPDSFTSRCRKADQNGSTEG